MPEHPRDSSADLVGERIAKFAITERLAAGGMGVVYRARDETLKRDVALKVLSAATEADAKARSRFLREAQGLAAVTHPNIATIFETGEVDGRAFIAMELVDGESLPRHWSEARSSSDRCSRSRVERPVRWPRHTNGASFTATSNRATSC